MVLGPSGSHVPYFSSPNPKKAKQLCPSGGSFVVSVILAGKYLGFLSGTRNLKCRRQLLEQFGFWHFDGKGISEVAPGS